VGTTRYGVGDMATVEMDEVAGLHPRCWRPPITPPPQSEQDIDQILAVLGEHIFVPGWMLLVTAGLHHAGSNQSVETIGEDVAGDAQIVVKIFEASDPHEEVPQDQDGPTVSDDVQGVGDRAVEECEAFSSWHGLILGLRVAKCNGLGRVRFKLQPTWR